MIIDGNWKINGSAVTCRDQIRLDKQTPSRSTGVIVF